MVENVQVWLKSLNILFRSLSAAAWKIPQPVWKAVREDKKVNIYLQTEQIYAETHCEAIAETHNSIVFWVSL